MHFPSPPIHYHNPLKTSVFIPFSIPIRFSRFYIISHLRFFFLQARKELFPSTLFLPAYNLKVVRSKRPSSLFAIHPFLERIQTNQWQIFVSVLDTPSGQNPQACSTSPGERSHVDRQTMWQVRAPRTSSWSINNVFCITAYVCTATKGFTCIYPFRMDVHRDGKD